MRAAAACSKWYSHHRRSSRARDSFSTLVRFFLSLFSLRRGRHPIFFFTSFIVSIIIFLLFLLFSLLLLLLLSPLHPQCDSRYDLCDFRRFLKIVTHRVCETNPISIRNVKTNYTILNVSLQKIVKNKCLKAALHARTNQYSNQHTCVHYDAVRRGVPKPNIKTDPYTRTQ